MKKNTNNRMTEIYEQALKARANELNDETNALRMYADEVYRRIEAFDEMYDENDENVGWEEQEKMINEYDELDRELMSVDNRMTDLEERYEKFRKELNEFYGCEVLKNVDSYIKTHKKNL